MCAPRHSGDDVLDRGGSQVALLREDAEKNIGPKLPNASAEMHMLIVTQATRTKASFKSVLFSVVC